MAYFGECNEGNRAYNFVMRIKNFILLGFSNVYSGCSLITLELRGLPIQVDRCETILSCFTFRSEVNQFLPLLSEGVVSGDEMQKKVGTK